MKLLVSSQFYSRPGMAQPATPKRCERSGYPLAKHYPTAPLVTETPRAVKTEDIIMFFTLYTTLPGISVPYREPGSHTVLFSPWKQLRIWQHD